MTISQTSSQQAIADQKQKRMLAGAGLGGTLGIAALEWGIASAACPPLFVLGCAMVGAGLISSLDQRA